MIDDYTLDRATDRPRRRAAGRRRGTSRAARSARLTINKYQLIYHACRARPCSKTRSSRRWQTPAAVKDLTARFDISQPAVSQHLATLKDAGLVNGRREGRCIYYRVEPRGMKPLINWIAHYRAFWTERVDRLEQLLEKMDR